MVTRGRGMFKYASRRNESGKGELIMSFSVVLLNTGARLTSLAVPNKNTSGEFINEPEQPQF